MALAGEREDDTIVAVSSGSPPAAIAVVRISGRKAVATATAMAGPLPKARRAGLRALCDAAGDLLDRALVLVFPGPRSATGEDVVEFHCHGGRAVVEAVEQAVVDHEGVRRAQPGEFTRRALAHGRIDLIEAEGLADLLEAETESERRLALQAAEGQVSRAIRGWAERTSDLSAMVEALIDYAEDDDVGGDDQFETVIDAAARLADDIDAVLASPPVERWRDGFRVVLAGPPNAGKSTLINALAARDAALVSPMAGTTRDRIEVTVRRQGRPYVLVDTAGLRDDAEDPIERQGITLAEREIDAADLVLWLGDEAPADAKVLRIRPKADLSMSLDALKLEGQPAGVVSALVPETIERLWVEIDARSGTSDARMTMPLTRHAQDHIADAAAALRLITNDIVVAAERLRQARSAFASALGYDATEAMLDALFSRFCLGK